MKHWGSSVRPTEEVKTKVILPVEQSLDDQEAKKADEDEEPAGEQKQWEEFAEKYEELQRRVAEQFENGARDKGDGPPHVKTPARPTQEEHENHQATHVNYQP